MNENINLKEKNDELLKKSKEKIWFNSDLLEKALEFGKKKHQRQVRKNSGDPYFIHPIRVAINLIDEPDASLDLILAALLHDTVEDTETTFEEIEIFFGKNTEILVNGMTKPNSNEKSKIGPEKFYEDYFRKLRKFSKIDNRVLKLKLSDRIDNIKEYALFATKEKIENYIWESYKYLNLCSDLLLETDLINILKNELITLKSYIMKKEL